MSSTSRLRVTWQVSYTRQELLIIHEYLCSPSVFGGVPVFTPCFWWGPCVHPLFLVGSMLFIFLVFCVVLCCVLFVLTSSCVLCVPNVASFSGLSILDCLFGFLMITFIILWKTFNKIIDCIMRISPVKF